MNKQYVILLSVIVILICITNLISASTWTSNLDSGLKDYWTFDESTGTNVFNYANNSVGGGNLTTTGGPAFVTGKIGNALETNYPNPNNEYARRTPHDVTGNWSMSFWANMTSNTGIFMGNGAGNRYIYFSGVTALTTQLSAGTIITTIVNSKNIWSYFTITYDYDTSTTRVYQNGTLINTDVGTLIGANFSDIIDYFGTFSGLTAKFEGRMDEIGIWNRTLTASEVTQLYNSGSGISPTVTPPTSKVVTLISPNDNDKILIGNQIFTSNANDGTEYVKNLSLIINKSGTWQTNYTNNYSGSICHQETANASSPYDNSCSLNYTGNYLLNSLFNPVQGYDGNYGTANQWISFDQGEFYINYSKPPISTAAYANISFYNGTTNPDYIKILIPSSCFNYNPKILQVFINDSYYKCYDGNWTKILHLKDAVLPQLSIYEESIDWVIGNFTTNITDSIGLSVFYPSTFDWTTLACFSDGTCEYALTNRTITYSDILENKVTYNNLVISGSTESFTLNVTSTGISRANFYYNNTLNNVSINVVDGNYILTSSLNVPAVNLLINKSFYWTLQSTSGLHNSTIYNQTVTNVSISSGCTTGYNFLNITNYDEQNLSSINATVEYVLTLQDPNNNLITILNGKSTGYNISFCSSLNLTNSSLNYNLQLRYYGINYYYKTYNIQNSITSNLPINIPLYYLNNSLGNQFKINYVDFYYLKYPGAIIQIQRQYLDTNTYNLVEIPLFDNNGQALASFNTNNIRYKLIVINNGQILDIFTEIFPSCQNIVLGTCEINLRGAENVQTSTIDDFTYNLNQTNNSLILTYIIPSGTPRTVSFVTNQDSRFLNNISTCNNSIFASGGTITCPYNNTVGDSIINTRIFISDGTILFASVLVSEDLSGFYSLNNYFIAFILLLSLALISVGSEVLMVLGAGIGIIFLGVIFLIKGVNIFTTISSISWLIIAIVLILYYVSKKNDRT